MFKWRLAELTIEYQEEHGKPLSYRRLARELGMSKHTVTGMANNSARQVNLSTMNKIMNYLSEHLNRPLTTNDLLQYEQDNE
jgi:DNA-binding Xre family transcriptional regulator